MARRWALGVFVLLAAVSSALGLRVPGATRLQCATDQGQDKLTSPEQPSVARLDDDVDNGAELLRRAQLQIRFRELLRQMEDMSPSGDDDAPSAAARTKVPTLQEAAQLVRRRREMEQEIEIARQILRKREEESPP